MSFGFGNTTQTAFGCTPPKATGFGAPFGSTPSTSTTTGFGGFGSSFGTTTQAQPTFGTSFGAPAAGATAPTFGTSFGTPAASATPAFGSFGTPSTSAPAFGSFGTQSTAPAFGTGTFGVQPTTTTTSLFGSTTKPSLFSTPTASAAAPSLFSTPTTSSNLFGTGPSLFGSTSTTATPIFGTATTTNSLFGGGFGTAATTTTPSLFGSNTSTLGTGLFGTPASTAPSLFSGFGSTSTAPTGFGTTNTFGGFGTPNTLGGGFGVTNTLGGSNVFGAFGGTNTFGGNTFGGPKLPGSFTPDEKKQQILASFYAINLFGDERDDIIKKWNMLQACWGTGKGYYNTSQQPVDYDHYNPFYRFKTIGYVVLPTTDNADGFVKLLFHKKENELNATKESLITGLSGILGNKPNLSVSIEHIKAISEDDSEVMITVSEKGVTGTSRKIQSTDLTTFLNQPQQKQQLTNVGVYYIGPFTMPSKTQIQEYLKNPPTGIDIHMWQAAQSDNPLPNKYLPTPMNGFTDLKRRMLCEEYETSIHRAFIEKVNKEITELKRKHSASIARITEQKQKFLQLQHRVLRILVKQEVTRKVGLALQPEEEVLRSRLEMLYSHLNVPTQFRGQLNELLSTIKMINVTDVIKTEKYKMDPKAQDDIKQFLKMEQEGIQHLINIISKDIKDLKIICDGLSKVMPHN